MENCSDSRSYSVGCLCFLRGKRIDTMSEMIFSISRNKIVIDADGCPVVKKTVKLANEFSAECILVCDTSHYYDIGTAKTVVVSQGEDSADFYIVNHIKAGDIVVTQDYGLAAMCLAKKACVINQDGKIYGDDNIGGLLESRAIGKKIRRAGGRLKGPVKRRDEQDIMFVNTLRRLLENAEV